MKSSASKFKIIFSLMVLLILAGLISFGFYIKYKRNNLVLSTKISSLEKQVATLGTALQDSASISEANKKQLQEMTTKSNAPVSSSENSLTSVVAKAAPAVVSIVVSKDIPLVQAQYVNPFGDDPAFRDINLRIPVFKEVGTKQQEIAAGSGFILDSNGYILTNKHVVADEKASYTIVLSSGEKKAAQVIYRDESHDIAVMKISGDSYPSIALGDSSGLKLGQTVAAIGNALGEYNNSVSVGIISGLNRTIEAQDPEGQTETLSGIVQTDAAINRGNSGGPLLDLSARVVGINVAMEQGANNISFAIPVNEIKYIVNKVIPQ